MQEVDFMLHNAAQLVTCASGGQPKRGTAMRDVGIIDDGALVVQNGQIIAVGTTAELEARYTARNKMDTDGYVIVPGFVDPHTHLVFAGERSYELEMRLQGASYLDILKAGGGILHTMQATRAETQDNLTWSGQKRLNIMLEYGTTTAEIKTGYGLDTESELRTLRVIEILEKMHPMDIVPTFLAAHAIPPEYRDNAEGYVQLVIDEMLPRAVAWYRTSTFQRSATPFFMDAFCEDGAFSPEQSRRIWEAGARWGLGIKAHTDEFNNLGGTHTAIELGAVSVDHLDHISQDEIALLGERDTIAVVIPTVNFHLGSHHYAPARDLIDHNAVLALSTDMNPGSAPCFSMQMVMALATRYQRLLPAEALNAATINAAYAIGLGDRIGSLEVGKQADFLVIDAPDYHHLSYQFGGNLVKQVFKKGQRLL